MKTVFFGLGSNLGDRTQYLSKALSHLISESAIIGPIRVSPTYQSQALLKPGAHEAWNKDFLNLVVQAHTSLSPQALMTAFKKTESVLGREVRERWAPREIDIDLLFYAEEEIADENLTVPHPELKNRDFWLKPLVDLCGDTDLPVLNRSASSFLSQLQDFNRAEKIPLSILPLEFMSVINITPDSFSDGGRFNDVESALAQAELQVNQGCGILDIGAESTRPGASSLSAEAECARLKDIIPALSWFRSRKAPWVKLSIDTRKSPVAELALEYAFDWVNDVSAGEDKNLIALLERSSASYVFMHNLGVPVDKTKQIPLDQDPVAELETWARQKKQSLVQAGINEERLIWDPGIGFGKQALHSASLLCRLQEFEDLKMDMLVGHSRKSFLSLITKEDFKDRDLESALISAQLQNCPRVRYVRVHDAEMSIKACRTQLLTQGAIR